MPLSRVNLGIVTREWLLAKVGGRGEPDWKAARILHVQFDEERVRDEKGEYEQCLSGLHFVRAPYATSSYSASSTGTLLGKVATYLAMIRICLFIT